MVDGVIGVLRYQNIARNQVKGSGDKTQDIVVDPRERISDETQEILRDATTGWKRVQERNVLIYNR